MFDWIIIKKQKTKTHLALTKLLLSVPLVYVFIYMKDSNGSNQLSIQSDFWDRLVIFCYIMV